MARKHQKPKSPSAPVAQPATAALADPPRRSVRLLIVIAGIVLTQFILYGPSLLGLKILLPLDILALPGHYLPRTPEVRQIVPEDSLRSDLVLQMEPMRRYYAAELRAGRFPTWTPYQFAGAPTATIPKFSPFMFLEALVASPVILAWEQLLYSLISGVGAYLLGRRILRVGFWPAAIVAWCYPLTGFFVLWQGFKMAPVVVWLPWLLLAVDRLVRGTARFALVEVSLFTALTLLGGGLDVSGQVLLTSGLYALWCWWDEHRARWTQPRALFVLARPALAWALGFLLAMPFILPLLEYSREGARMKQRSAGREERPPVGRAALPQTIFPDYHGTTHVGSYYRIFGNQLESAAAVYTGLFATLLVAPLAFCSRRHRSLNLFWVSLGLLGVGWTLNVPGLVSFLRLPGLNMMSHNRFVFATSLAILALVAVGLEVLCRGELRRRGWFWVPLLLLAGLGIWSIQRTYHLPEPIATQLEATIRSGKSVKWMHTVADVQRLRAWHVQSAWISAVFCAIACAGWLVLWFRPPRARVALVALTLLLAGDLLWFAWGRSTQSDPALYYPNVPVLNELAQATPGRIVGASCLPAVLSQLTPLHDIRGYDAIDPARLMQLMALAIDSRSRAPEQVPYAYTQWFAPRTVMRKPATVEFPPVLDMLNVRYMVFRGPPTNGIVPVYQSPDYWVLVNPRALPRAYIPARVAVIADDQARLQAIGATNFNPRAVAYLETPVNLPADVDARGTVDLASEIPTRVTLEVKMETPGLVVLADLWDNGWHATLNGAPVPILRANHALRGVVVPAGNATLEFRYAPRSLAMGLKLAGAALGVLAIWSVFVALRARKKSG
jgi:hypothetical protein